uniref:Kelch domain containing 3 n=1 Tax=Hucho hucho TaxID=62062 RepID=A0A4W5QIA0_9TELE
MKLPPVRTGGREHARDVPYMRYGHTAVLLEDTIYIWGGRNDTEGACNVLYAFDINNHRWFTPNISGTVPGARDGHSACILGKAMYIFGGYEQLLVLVHQLYDVIMTFSCPLSSCLLFSLLFQADCFSNDIHKLDTTTMAWSLINARALPSVWRQANTKSLYNRNAFKMCVHLSVTHTCQYIQSWPKVLRMTQILIFTKSAASVCLMAICIYSRMS